MSRVEDNSTKKPRRDQGTGYLFRYPKCKRWVIQYYVDGVRKREATGLTNKTQAQNVLNQRLAAVGKGEAILPARARQPVRMEDLYRVVEDLARNRGPRALRDAKGRWRNLAPFWAARRAAAVTTEDMRAYTRMRQEAGKANATINRELACLRRMFRLALRETPPRILRVPHIDFLPENNVRTGFVEDAEYVKLATAATELWLKLLLELAYSYGWRVGELLGLQVRQVDLSTGKIRLKAGTTKNKEGREVEMTGRIRALMTMAVAGKRAEDYVLTRSNGRPVREFRLTWANLCVSVGLGAFRCLQCQEPWEGKRCGCGGRKRQYRGLIFHDFRRSAAKRLRRLGVQESVIMATGGWRTAEMFRRYAIVSPTDQADVVARLESSSLKVGLIVDETPQVTTDAKPRVQ